MQTLWSTLTKRLRKWYKLVVLSMSLQVSWWGGKAHSLHIFIDISYLYQFLLFLLDQQQGEVLNPDPPQREPIDPENLGKLKLII